MQPPTTPRGTPAAPTFGPVTGGGAPAAGTPGARRGMPMVLTHGRSAERLLRIDWDHAVYVPPDRGRQTQVSPAPLPEAEAIRYLAGADKRPLLVLRECRICTGTDMALLRADVPNERTMLLTGFFHCVRLPPQAAEAGQPFSLLFPGHSHLFLCDADGTGRVDLSGKQSQSDVLRAMRQVLERNLPLNTNGIANALQKDLAQLDRLDALEADALDAIDAELDRRGDKSPRLADLQEKAKALAEERQKILDHITELGHKRGG